MQNGRKKSLMDYPREWREYLRINGLRFALSGVFFGIFGLILAHIANAEAPNAGNIFYMGSPTLNSSAENAIYCSISAVFFGGLSLISSISTIFRLPASLRISKKTMIIAIIFLLLSFILGVLAVLGGYNGYNTLPSNIKPFIL